MTFLRSTPCAKRKDCVQSSHVSFVTTAAYSTLGSAKTADRSVVESSESVAASQMRFDPLLAFKTVVVGKKASVSAGNSRLEILGQVAEYGRNQYAKLGNAKPTESAECASQQAVRTRRNAELWLGLARRKAPCFIFACTADAEYRDCSCPSASRPAEWCAMQNSAIWGRSVSNALPNPSLKPSPNGVARRPSSAGPAAHFALVVQRATPSVPA